MAKLPAVLGAAAGCLLLLAATFSTLNSNRGTPAELLASRQQLFGKVNDFDLARPSWHDFDYTRPDFDNALDLNLLGGKSGFFKQAGGVQGTSLMAMPRPMPAGAPVEAVLVPVPQLAGTLQDERDALTNEQRSEAARCNGMLHACTNWMALQTGKMRVMVYEKGSWCTDDDLEGPECYENEQTVAEDHVFDIPAEGGELSQELWDVILKSCPVIEGCPKPKAFSNTPEGSVYADALPAALAEPVQEYVSSLSLARAHCCVAQQQALGARARAIPV